MFSLIIADSMVNAAAFHVDPNLGDPQDGFQVDGGCLCRIVSTFALHQADEGSFRESYSNFASVSPATMIKGSYLLA